MFRRMKIKGMILTRKNNKYHNNVTSRKRNKLFYYVVNGIIIFKIIPMMDLGQKLYRLAKLSLRSFKLSYAWSFSPLYTFTSHPRFILHDCSSRLNNSISEFSASKLFKSYFCTPTNPDNEILDNNLSFFLLSSTPQFFSATIILLLQTYNMCSSTHRICRARFSTLLIVFNL